MKQVLSAINKVRAATKAVAKNGQNTFHKYSYAMAADVLETVRGAMSEEGLVVWPKMVKDISYTKAEGVLEGTVVYCVAHAESGESIEVEIRAAGEDKGDKKAYKLQTGALKYLFIQLFQLPTYDDPEGHEGDQPQRPAGKQTNGAPPADKPAAEKPLLMKGSKEWNGAVKALETGALDKKGNPITLQGIATKYSISKEDQPLLEAAELKGREVIA